MYADISSKKILKFKTRFSIKNDQYMEIAVEYGEKVYYLNQRK